MNDWQWLTPDLDVLKEFTVPVTAVSQGRPDPVRLFDVVDEYI